MAFHRTDCSIPQIYLQAAAGFEPANNGFANRRLENTTPAKAKTCELSKEPLTPQWTPKPPKQGKIDTSELPPDLVKMVAVWPSLPEHIKAAIKVLAQV